MVKPLRGFFEKERKKKGGGKEGAAETETKPPERQGRACVDNDLCCVLPVSLQIASLSRQNNRGEAGEERRRSPSE